MISLPESTFIGSLIMNKDTTNVDVQNGDFHSAGSEQLNILPIITTSYITGNVMSINSSIFI